MFALGGHLRLAAYHVVGPTAAQCPSGSRLAGSQVQVRVFPPGPGAAAKMSNEPPPPYPGGPTAPLLEKSGAPSTPGRVIPGGPFLAPSLPHVWLRPL